MSFTIVRFHLRGIRRHTVGLVRTVLGLRSPPRTDFSGTSAAFYAPLDPFHPSQLCTCPAGTMASPEHHYETCVWAQSMCRDCRGNGHCPCCGGDGIDPNAPPVPYQHAGSA